LRTHGTRAPSIELTDGGEKEEEEEEGEEREEAPPPDPRGRTHALICGRAPRNHPTRQPPGNC